MTQVLNATNRVTHIMAEITDATAEQSRGIEHVNQAIADMDQVTQQNAALAEEAAAAAASMQQQASELAEVVGTFRIEGTAALQALK